MQQLFDYLQFFFCLPLQRQADSHHSAASGGIGDVKLAAVEVDDLIADRQADAAAAGAGGALVEFLLHVCLLYTSDAADE